jgi:tetratricopeptide (TPR) repeat protein
MKYIFPALFAAFIIASCNNEKVTGNSPTNKISTEDSLVSLLQEHPDSTLLRETLIQWYRDESEYDKALSYTRSALEKEPDNGRWHQIMGTLLFEMEDTSGAIQAFEKAMLYAPSTYNLKTLALLYANSGQTKALIIANQIGSDPKQLVDANYIRGVYYSNIKKTDSALHFFDACLIEHPTYMDAYREKGILLFNLGRHQQSIETFEKAMLLNNQFEEAYYWLGKNYETVKDTLNAIEYYERALLYDPNYWEAKEALEKLQPK